MATPNLSTSAERHAVLIAELDAAANDLGLFGPEHPFERDVLIRELRRRGRADAADPVGTLTLVEENGVLYWRDGSVRPSDHRRRARHRVGAYVSGEIVVQRRFEMLQPDQVSATLQKIDDRFSAPRGFRQYKNGRLNPAAPGPYKGRTLLLIHGTFSNNDNLIQEFHATTQGQALLARAEKHYSQVLVFDHATIAISPIMNALELARLLAGSTHTVDVVAHSRGGLVTRWWLEGLGTGAGKRPRSILIGSPIAGTSLASGPRLRSSLDLLTNIGVALERVMGLGAIANPFLTVPAALLRVVVSITGIVGKLPIMDAAVAMIPGLFSQARISNNIELLRLHSGPAVVFPEYFTVRSNFEPKNEGWKLWRYFRKTTLLDPLADAVFDGENDLVVDTDSMSDFGNSGAKLKATWDFGTSSEVHHCNYFRQKETMDFIAQSFQVP